ncbi:sensor histidine kinase [Sphingomonas carotinifaciens]|uniref:sensor histidine kinase n=1 Tax=Sphingomonas carotinifaciens TaxID=1166323 RepID=UPI001F0724CD|nr:ATP-binding protein [Sphingomonas carotinifaciens]
MMVPVVTAWCVTRPASLRNVVWLLAALVLAFLGAMLAAQFAERRTLAAQRAEVVQDAHLRAALLNSEIARFRLLPLALADDRDVHAALANTPGARLVLNRKLERLARIAGTPTIYVIAPDGQSVAASNWRTRAPFVGIDYRFRPYFREARLRGEGAQYALGSVSRRPGLYLSRRIARGGVIVIKLEFDRVERAWARDRGISFVHDARGIVLVTSRADWRFAAIRRLDPAVARQASRDIGAPGAGRYLLPVSALGDGTVKLNGTGQRFVTHALHVQRAGWTLTQMRRIDRVIASARLAASLATGAIILALAATGGALALRIGSARRREADLAQAVAERTADLRREAEERIQAEARAAELRESLQQANRLASLGQITASVAHETAQPITAIRTYAQTSGMLLDRGRMDDVRANLATIARLADRIGVMTQHLRGFSRKQTKSLHPVPLDAVIEGAMLILQPQMRGVAIDRPSVVSAMVIGDKVRLEQVLVNLVQNALQAMMGEPAARIVLSVAQDDTHVCLSVQDNGPGIAPEVLERLFTPFNTNRETGLGLGLVIAQDIMTDLGGWLRHRPSTIGACFEIGMRRA